MDKSGKKEILKCVFFSTLYLSAFTFGGGYVIVSLLKKKFVDELNWIKEEEMLDLVAIAQSSPGAIAVNGAIIVGYRLAGIIGVVVAVLGAIIPPMIILTVVSMFYSFFKSNYVIQALLKGMKSGVCAVIFSVVYDMTAEQVKNKAWKNLLIMVIAFIANYYYRVNVVFILLVVAVYGILSVIVRSRIKE